MKNRQLTLKQTMTTLFTLFFLSHGWSQIMITPPATTDVTIQCSGVPSDPETVIQNYEGTFTVTNNCAAFTWSNDFTTLTEPCAGTGTASVTYTVDDGCNTASVTINFTVEDTNAPDIMGAQDVTVECDGMGNVADLTTWLNNDGNSSATDVCSPTNLISKFVEVNSDVTTNDPFIAMQNAIMTGCNFGVIGTITVEFFYVDDCGNTSSTVADFSIEDTQGPPITMPAQDINVECDGMGNAADLANWVNANGFAVAEDVCNPTGTITWRSDPVNPVINFSCGNAGSVTVDFYATDECGEENPVPTTATFTISDSQQPTWTTDPTPLTIECDGSIDPGGQIAAWLLSVGDGGTATDDCNPGLVTYSNNYAGLTNMFCGFTGSATVQFTASDGCGGNTSSRFATVTIEDTTPPTWTSLPSDITIECDGTTNPGGQITTWLNSVGTTGAATDVCGGNVFTFSNDFAGLSDDCGATGTATVTFTATDACGLTSTEMATITIVDNTPPSFVVPGAVAAQNLILECNANTATAINAWLAANGNASPVEDCGTLTWTNDFAGYTAVCPGPGTATVTFTATDACGNMATTTAIVTVQDTQGPNITTNPMDMVVQCDTFLMSDYTAWLDAHGGAIAMDACSNIDNSVGSTNWTTATVYNAACTNTGQYTVQFIVTDDCGFTTNAVANFIIIDTRSPDISPTSTSVTEECGGGDDQSDLNAWIDNIGGAIANDGCNSSSWVNFDYVTTANVSVQGIGITFGDYGNYPQVVVGDCDWSVQVTFTATDECGNLSATSGIFGLEDFGDPVLSAIPADITVDCVAPAPFMPTAMDDCDQMVNITLVADTVFNCANDYVVTRTWTATDDCGNTDMGSRVITVEDNDAPVVIAPADMTVECSDNLMAGNPTITEACDANPNVLLVADTVFGGCLNEYVITRTWTVTDACGNVGMDSQVITVDDNTFPIIGGVLPVDMTVDCNNIPAPPATGIDITGTDNCTLDEFTLNVTETIGNDPDLCPFYNYVITRTWVAVDICGNTTQHIQNITVQDVDAPTFTRPADIIAECDEILDLMVTGDVTNIVDNCDATPTVTFFDNIAMAGTCTQNYTLERTWTVTDACGNATSEVQTITVQDSSDPTFTATPQSLTIVCMDGVTADAAYTAWLANNAGGVATDNCGTVTWYPLEPGSYTLSDPLTYTTPPVGLAAAICPSPTAGVYRSDEVSFVAVDECGNAIEQTVTFTVEDFTPPVFVNCPVDFTLNNDPGTCGAASALNPPLILDACNSNSANVNVSVTEPFVSPNPGDDATIVNPITLDIGPLPVNPAVAADPVTLTIDLNEYDGEELTEFFNILNEDGTTIGQTTNSAMQCGNSTTTLTLSGSQINSWASIDGFVTITLVPNVTVDPIFAINDICPQGPPTGGNSTATATLDYTSNSPNALIYEYSLNNGSRVQVSAGTVVPYTFDVGTTLVTYYATDCAGNESSCSYNVTVIDNELPTLSCPADLTVDLLPTDFCAGGVNVDLVPPTNLFDNCGFQNNYSQVSPNDFNSSLLTFTYNPNYLDYVADDKTFNFFGVGANAANGFVTFTVRIEGDVEDADEYYEIYGEDGSLIGTTQAGQPNVMVTPGNCPALSVSLTTISVPASLFNVWAVDGAVTITATSFDNFTTPPPGITGDGIGPACTVFPNGTPDGMNDGASNMTVVLDYTSVAPSYFMSGATVLNNGIFPVPLVPVTHTLNVGVTTITYQIEDVNGNVNTCSYDITIEDNIAPMAMCQGTTIFVNPDGGDYILDPSEIDNVSGDNCGITSMTVSPNTFTCLDVGTTVNVTLTVVDGAGNMSSCVAPVNIQSIQLAPSFSIGLCGDENLNLFANAPAGLYTYSWSGPNNYVSFDENPVIQNADPSYSGTYVVTITGLTSGCTASGAMTISINAAPNTPIAQASSGSICSNEDVVLSTQSYSGTIVTYSWYEGVSPTGNLIATTPVPSYTLSNLAGGSYTYYVVVEVDACQSNPSGAISVNVTESPVITGITNTAIDCASGNEDMILTPTVSPAGNYIYTWTGPNGFSSASTEATLPDISSADNGSYTLVVEVDGASGCSSNPFTHVISVDDLPATPIITSLDNQLCEGDLLQLQLVNNPYIGANISYTWITPSGVDIPTSDASLTINSTTVNDAGNYTVYVTVDGCTSDTSGNFVVNVNSIPAAPAISYNGPVCEGTTLQLSTDFIPGASYFWTGPNNFNSTNQNPLVFPVDATHEGTYFLSVVVSGCPSAQSLPLLVQVNDAPEAVLATSAGAVCLDDPMATLELSVTSASAIPGATYTWYDAATNAIISGPTTSLSVSITDLSAYSAGVHDFYVVANVSGCPSASSIPTSVTFDFIPTNGAFAGDDIFVCENNSTILSAQSPTVGSGEWNQTGGTPTIIANPNQATTAITGLATGQTYTFQWTLSNGACTDYAMDEVVVTVDEEIGAADAGTDFELCNATTATLNAIAVTGSTVGTWSQPSSQALLGVTIIDATDPNTLVTGLQPGNTYQFIWTLSNAGCGDFSSDIVVLTNQGVNGVNAFAGTDFELCGDEETTLNAAAIPLGITGTWTSPTAGVTILNPNQPNTFVTDLQQGNNVFVWTLSNPVCGDFSTDEVVVFYEPSPVAEDDAYSIPFNGALDIDVLANDNIPNGYIISYSNPTNGTLEQENGVVTYTSNLVYVGSDEFTYEVCSEICPDECSTATVTLTVGDDATCDIPTIFSPNNDGINDEFVVPCLGKDTYPNNEVAIFNQWGDEVFREGPYQNNWRGTYNGEELPTGTYFWVVDLGDGNTPKSGFLVLER